MVAELQYILDLLSFRVVFCFSLLVIFILYAVLLFETLPFTIHLEAIYSVNPLSHFLYSIKRSNSRTLTLLREPKLIRTLGHVHFVVGRVSLAFFCKYNKPSICLSSFIKFEYI